MMENVMAIPATASRLRGLGVGRDGVSRGKALFGVLQLRHGRRIGFTDNGIH
jgi:hypothetical protein